MAAQPGSESHINEAIGKAYAEYGVSEAVRAGDFLFIGGIVAFDDEGKVIAPGDGKTQQEQDHICYLFRFGDAPQGNAFFCFLKEFRVRLIYINACRTT